MRGNSWRQAESWRWSGLQDLHVSPCISWCCQEAAGLHRDCIRGPCHSARGGGTARRAPCAPRWVCLHHLSAGPPRPFSADSRDVLERVAEPVHCPLQHGEQHAAVAEAAAVRQLRSPDSHRWLASSAQEAGAGGRAEPQQPESASCAPPRRIQVSFRACRRTGRLLACGAGPARRPHTRAFRFWKPAHCLCSEALQPSCRTPRASMPPPGHPPPQPANPPPRPRPPAAHPPAPAAAFLPAGPPSSPACAAGCGAGCFPQPTTLSGTAFTCTSGPCGRGRARRRGRC